MPIREVPPPKRWLDVSAAATHCAVSRETIYRACLSGDLTYTRVNGKRNYRFRREWLDTWMETTAKCADHK